MSYLRQIFTAFVPVNLLGECVDTTLYGMILCVIIIAKLLLPLIFMCIQIYISFLVYAYNVFMYCSFAVVKFVMSLNFVDGYGKRKFF